MSKAIDNLLSRLADSGQAFLLNTGLKGLEKESLRIGTDGLIAHTPHPAALGSALTHPQITTDYSEALLELITPPYSDPAATLDYLDDIHHFVYANIGDECLLGSSMPCGIDGDESIPIARYGSSNIGRMKYIYRLGLAYRYGRTMQAIAGIHFNYSVADGLWPVLQDLAGDRRPLPEFIADAYFGMIRNILRHGWLVLYLFGASPAICRAFFTGREGLAKQFDRFDGDTLYKPYATSLRMSDIGYKNNNQAGLRISFNHLDEYLASLGHAIATPNPDYLRIGVKVDGAYRQLNANLLQIENEYYNSVRPKQIVQSGEKPTLALKRRGIRYVELRSLDLDPFQPCGLGLAELRFLEAFMLYCLFEASVPFDETERCAANANLQAVAVEGRRPGLTLQRDGTGVALKQWAEEISASMAPLCAMLDHGLSDAPYSASLAQQCAKIRDPAATPSARILAQMQESGECFGAFAQRLSHQHARQYRSRPMDAQKIAVFRAMAEKSLAEQQHMEADNALPFDDFLQRYFAQH
ncbi:MAG: glutamate--cysteine ligase [Methylococcaceae bacterium]|nr:MAG: glutamate--cysteine ligase [Methylococcaceae bacterium]